ncbi:hypothetical protein [Streptomyces sp. NBC_01304]|uniref:hypothetical protein n=1 Tax=Streptomyces sp. NBC_01304 TaxID=2903818 RepID=UPI002E11B3BC|nr:hypothetical protein OG430_44665 [Streptomyces sp. NBC_01304]
MSIVSDEQTSTDLDVEQLRRDIDWVLAVRLSVPDRAQVTPRAMRLLADLKALGEQLDGRQRLENRALLMEANSLARSGPIHMSDAEFAWHTQASARVARALAHISGVLP